MHGINAQFPFFYFFFLLYYLFIYLFLDKHVFNEKKKQTNCKPGNNEWANPRLDGNCWENMPVVERADWRPIILCI